MIPVGPPRPRHFQLPPRHLRPPLGPAHERPGVSGQGHHPPAQPLDLPLHGFGPASPGRGACRVARQGALREPDAGGSGAPRRRCPRLRPSGQGPCRTAFLRRAEVKRGSGGVQIRGSRTGQNTAGFPSRAPLPSSRAYLARFTRVCQSGSQAPEGSNAGPGPAPSATGPPGPIPASLADITTSVHAASGYARADRGRGAAHVGRLLLRRRLRVPGDPVH